MAKPRVLMADDHRIVLEGLRGVLDEEFEVLPPVTNGRELVEAALRLQPDVVIADISMPLLNGIEAARQLQDRGSTAKIVFLTMHADGTYATRAFQAGGSAYVLKHSASDELVTAMRAVLHGKTYISPGVENTGTPMKRAIEVTPRQREVLQLLAEGKSAKEIGAILDISARTAEAHKYKMMDELGLKSTAQLVQYAIRHGIVSNT
jgi:DNA-binding NarL/FixJ family response regulator